MRTIIWKAKHDNEIYDASTPEKEAVSFKAIFDFMESQGDYECSPPKAKRRALYARAKKGDAKAIKEFLLSRSRDNYEYEEIRIEDTKNP